MNPGEANDPEEVLMGSGHIEQSGRELPAVEVGESERTQYLDLDDDGVPDAVQTTATREYDCRSGAEVVEEIRELDSGIGPDGVPTTITVTDAVTIDTDHDGTPNAAVMTVIRLAARASDQPQQTDDDEGRSR